MWFCGWVMISVSQQALLNLATGSNDPEHNFCIIIVFCFLFFLQVNYLYLEDGPTAHAEKNLV